MIGFKSTVAVLFLVGLSRQLSVLGGSDVEEELDRACRGLSEANKISQIEEIIRLLKKPRGVKKPPPEPSTGWLVSKFRKFSSKGTCRTQADSFLDLEPILAEKQNVCLKSHIDRLEAYNRKHFSSLTSNKLVYDFFKSYAYQVSFICKQHLWRSLNIANEKYVKQEDYEKVMPWLSSNKNCQVFEKQKKGKRTSPEMIRCEAINAIAKIDTYTELADALEADTHSPASTVYPFVATEAAPATGTTEIPVSTSTALNMTAPFQTTAQQERLFLVLPKDKRVVVEDMLEACDKFEAIYDQTVMPIIRMAQMGYDVVFKNFLRKCAEEELIRRWFSITLICKSMRATSVADNHYVDKYNEESNIAQGDENKCIIVQDIVNTDNEKPRNKLPEKSLFDNPIDDEIWISDFIPGRLGQFQTDISRRISKALHIEEMDKYVLFKRNVKYVRDSSVKLTIVGLSLIGINAMVN